MIIIFEVFMKKQLDNLFKKEINDTVSASYQKLISFIDAAAADYNELLEAGMPPSEASERLMGPLGPKRPQAWSANVPKWSGFIDWNGIPPHVKTNNKPLREVYSTELGDLQSVMDRLGDFKRDGDLGADVGVVVP